MFLNQLSGYTSSCKFSCEEDTDNNGYTNDSCKKKLYKKNKPVAIQSAISNAQNNRSPKTFQTDDKEDGYLGKDKISSAILTHFEKSVTDF